jgi:hypothetical protein
MSKTMGVEKRGGRKKKKQEVVKGCSNSLEGENIVSKVVAKH